MSVKFFIHIYEEEGLTVMKNWEEVTFSLVQVLFSIKNASFGHS